MIGIVGSLYVLGASKVVVSQEDWCVVVFVTFILLPIVFFSLYYLFLKRSQSHKIIEWLGSKKVPVFSEFAFREVQIVLAVVMIKRDRYLLSLKYARLRNYVLSYFPAEKLDVEEIVDVFMDEKVPVDELTRWCNKNLTYGQKLETFCFVYEVAAIDDEVLDVEKEYLMYLIQKFALRNEDIPGVIEEKLFGNNKKTVDVSFSMLQSYYEVLEVAPGATDKEIKESYRRLVKQFHPDSNPHLSAGEKKVFSDKFQQVQEAYDKLTNS